MYVLVIGEDEVIGGDTTVRVFETYKEAYDAMMDDAIRRFGRYEFIDGMYVIEDYGGFCFDVVGWQIREVEFPEVKE